MSPTRVERGAEDPSPGAYQHEAATHEGQLHAEREHLRALLELTNAGRHVARRRYRAEPATNRPA
jgi:hypothetical protein